MGTPHVQQQLLHSDAQFLKHTLSRGLQFVIATTAPMQSFTKPPYNVQHISLTQIATKHPKSYSALRNCDTTAEEEIQIHRAAVATWKTKLEGARTWRAELLFSQSQNSATPSPYFWKL